MGHMGACRNSSSSLCDRPGSLQGKSRQWQDKGSSAQSVLVQVLAQAGGVFQSAQLHGSSGSHVERAAVILTNVHVCIFYILYNKMCPHLEDLHNLVNLYFSKIFSEHSEQRVVGLDNEQTGLLLHSLLRKCLPDIHI